jgi:hypothetical protein
MASWRLELFFKSPSDLRLNTLPFLRAHHHLFRGVNITNKSKDDDLLESVSILQQELPNLDVCVHYSIKFNYFRSPAVTQTRLTAFLESLETRNNRESTCSVLLVSGSGKRKGLDSLSALENLTATGRPATARGVPIYIAFNPYLQKPEDLEIERDRLKAKLMTDRVAGVYLQMGTDLTALEAGLDYLENFFENTALNSFESSVGNTSSVEIYGSVFVPSKRLLAQMKFRPWNGVFLSEKYLNSVEEAEAITSSLLEIYKKRGVIPLVETAVKTEAEMKHVITLLGGSN